MFDRRVTKRRGDSFSFRFEDQAIIAWHGETVATALINNGQYVLRKAEDQSKRGLLCGIGVCWECRCVIDEQPNVRACMTPAAPGMVVRIQRGLE